MGSKIERNKLYDSANKFFLLEGSAVMKLSINAAKNVCENALRYKRLIIRIEGGIWHDTGFEARIDCIWDGLSNISNEIEAKENNSQAVIFIKEEEVEHNAFIITTKEFLLTKNIG